MHTPHTCVHTHTHIYHTWFFSHITNRYNLIEAHCYGIGRTGQLLSNHVAVETDGNVRRFDREGLRQLQCIVTNKDLRGQNVLHFHLFPLLRDCSTIAQSYQSLLFENPSTEDWSKSIQSYWGSTKTGTGHAKLATPIPFTPNVVR